MEELLYQTFDGGSLPILARVRCAVGSVTGHVTDVYVDGVGLRLPTIAAIGIGEKVELSLWVEGVERPVALAARVRARRDTETERRYRLRFVSREELAQKLPRGLYSLFNRRRCERVRLTSPLDSTLSSLGEGVRATAEIDGVSRGGCSLVVDADTERLFASTERVLIGLRQPGLQLVGKPRTWSVHAVIHNRQATDTGLIRYGCELLPENAAGALELERIFDYLLEREHALRAG